MKKFIFIFVIILFFSSIANAKQKNSGFSTIRDEETETFLKEITKPIFDSAGLNSKSIKIVIINEDSINAFVAGGQNIFVNTGLITALDEPDGLIGVLAHETGHIKAAHIIQKDIKSGSATASLIAGYVIGIGSVLLGAPPEAGFAISSAGTQYATRNFLAYSRKYESEADTIALDILKNIGVSPEGLIDILKSLQRKSSLNSRTIDEYAMTHPVTDDRISFLVSAIKQNPVIDRKTNDLTTKKFKRVKAKIIAFLYDMDKVTKIYGSSTDEYAIYAKAILAHRKGDYSNAIKYTDMLILQSPNDPYYTELKAQISYENGKINEAVNLYKKAIDLKAGSILFNLKLGIAQADLGTPQSLKDALSNLKTVLAIEPKNTLAIKNTAIIYGKMGQIGISYLYLAEEAMLSRKFDDVKLYIKQAEARIDKNSKEFKKLSDIKLELKKLID